MLLSLASTAGGSKIIGLSVAQAAAVSGFLEFSETCNALLPLFNHLLDAELVNVTQVLE
jgi:hypothetical protein